jgi:hypothetical protein
VFACTSLAEECVEGVVTASNGLVTGHLAIRLDTVLNIFKQRITWNMSATDGLICKQKPRHFIGQAATT